MFGYVVFILYIIYLFLCSSKALFSSKKVLDFGTVVFLFVYGNIV